MQNMGSDAVNLSISLTAFLVVEPAGISNAG
jgi:hypothetical protein